ncbi:hypothetical protein [Arenimonas fontis]|uniref:Lipoprotein n=1 Tax=Arenimonas fontis TaxID=2608255 RepID=A0A5B2ZCX8_9GAMM|nr:hypothetical protein [Arenimonas fontis]KAA2285044.1 hypothetical protein F0415_07320 [Arenimonas fontis]
MHRWIPALLLLLLSACRQEEAAPGATAPTPEPPPSASSGVPAPPVEPAAPGPEEVPRAFLCRGNEPFWALDAGDGDGLFKQPYGELALEGELRALAGGAWRYRGAPVDGPGEMVEALISPGQCFDTMADGPALPWSAVVSWPDGQGQGCCRAEYGLDMANAPAHDPAGKPQDDWSRLLPELGPALRRCAFDAGVATEAVTVAWPMNRGKAGVRLRDSGQDRFDCVVDTGTGAIDAIRLVAADDRLAGEGRPEWLPARDGAPVLHCGRVERALDREGKLTGWLYYREGCD